MEEIVNLIDTAYEYGLVSEVVNTALEAMKENPDLEPIQALKIALEEWDCNEE